MPQDFFIEGNTSTQYCPWCQQMQLGKLFLNGVRWCCRFETSCGREKVIGYTMPISALKKAKLISQPDVSPDPRLQNAVDTIRRDAQKEKELREFWGLDLLNSGRTRKKYI